MKRVVWVTAIVLTTLGLLILFWQLRIAVALFLFSLAVAAALRPAVDGLVARGFKRGLAILLVYLVGLGVLGGLLTLAASRLLTELELGTNQLTSAYEQIFRTWPQGTSFQQLLVERLPPPDELFKAIAGERGAMLARTVLGVAQGFFSGLSSLFIVIVLSIYWSSDRDHFERLWLSLLPSKERTRARDIWRSIEKGVGSYVRSEVIQSLLAAILLWLGYRLMGLQYPVLLALTGALLWLIPWLGALLAVILPVIMGFTIHPALAAAAAVYTLLVLLLLEVVVEPRFFNRRRYSSLLVIIIVVAMANAYGLVGLIVAPPLAAAIQIFFSNLARTAPTNESVQPGVQVANLRTRLEKVQEMVAGRGEETLPEMESLLGKLAELIDESSQAVRVDGQSETNLGLPAARPSSFVQGNEV